MNPIIPGPPPLTDTLLMKLMASPYDEKSRGQLAFLLRSYLSMGETITTVRQIEALICYATCTNRLFVLMDSIDPGDQETLKQVHEDHMILTEELGMSPAAEARKLQRKKAAEDRAEYVSAEKLARMFDPPLSICFIRALQKRRTIPFIRLGKRVVFSPDAVRRAIEQHCTVRPRGPATKEG